MPLRCRSSRPKAEPTIALINVVFLMLIFFMVAGTLAPPMNKKVELVEASEIEGRSPPNALVIHPDGMLNWGGEAINLSGVIENAQVEEGKKSLRLVPDRNLPASLLMAITANLKDAGIDQLFIVTKRGLE